MTYNPFKNERTDFFMRYINGKQVKIVSGTNAFDFETKLNGVLSDLNIRGISYDLQLNPATGLIAYVVYEESAVIPETIKDEYELRDERHFCIECPFFVQPTDGRFKYTTCGMEKHIRISQPCCEWFYEQLKEGRIKPREVWNGKKVETPDV